VGDGDGTGEGAGGWGDGVGSGRGWIGFGGSDGLSVGLRMSTNEGGK